MKKLTFSILCLFLSFCILTSFAKAKDNNYKSKIMVQVPKSEHTIKNIKKTLSDGRKFYSNDAGKTWKEIIPEGPVKFQVFAYNGVITIKSDLMNNSGYQIKLFNIYGEPIVNRNIDDNDLKFTAPNIDIQLVFYKIEFNGATIQNGKLILN